ncbi:histidine phosphatase family protein [Metabacillus sp. KIGAM252]|uniref:Histidine phosphatase family protein n=1 Tax=Metabacillus flavus TaxID=2823519 RepID=A0ABS5LIQ6_9BACI|nr:histidine phosphatase family protein [Metabacillus flavus]MBS2970603.1 histidine phosphatase family protein [Metabacillus flavus]
MTKLGIVRHGITEWNIEGRAQGSSDIPLHEQGLKEAEMLAERLKGEDWDLLYSSPLLRAKQTADFISKKHGGLEVLTDERIRETGGGEIEGTTEAERLDKWGTGWRELDLGREQSRQVTKRGVEFVEEILKKHPGKNILMVTHGSFIRHLLQELTPVNEEREPLKNTSITHLLIEDSKWSCGLYNCTKHLEIK